MVMKKIIFLFTIVIALIMAFIPINLYADEEPEVLFHDFRWKTKMDDFIAKMGNPVHKEVDNGFNSLIYQINDFYGYKGFFVAYFSKNGLEGGAYFFDCGNPDELKKCYIDVQKELFKKYGFTKKYDEINKEMRIYESTWDFKSGYIHLKVNTKKNDPVTLWISFPTLTKMLDGEN
jgi:hypothetical protein